MDLGTFTELKEMIKENTGLIESVIIIILSMIGAVGAVVDLILEWRRKRK